MLNAFKRVLTAFTLAAALPALAADKPNVLLIYTDDLGYGDLSCYGATAVQTPNIDKLANAGVRFTDGHCSSATCTPSRYSLLTGEYAFRKKGTGILSGDAGQIIADEQMTIADVMKQAGYATGAVGKWHLGLGPGNNNWNKPIPGPTPQDIGFDESFLMAATNDRVPCVYVRNNTVVNLDPNDPIRVSYYKDGPVGNLPTGKDHPELLKQQLHHGHDNTIINGISRIGWMDGGRKAWWVDEDMADVFVDEAEDFLDRHKDEPFFLFFATHNIHVPRVPNDRFVGKTDMGPRGDAIVEMDWMVGAVIAKLKAIGQLDNTLIIFSSDNGPVLNDGYLDESDTRIGDHQPAGRIDGQVLRGGKYSKFEAGTRVPTFVYWQGKVKPMVSDALVSQVDLLASLAALAGVDVPSHQAPDSLNQLDTWLGKQTVGRDHVVEHAKSQALREGHWKYIPPSGGASFSKNTGIELANSQEPQLYDLSTDPGETTNLAEKMPDKVASMHARLEALKAAGRTRPE